LEFGDWLFTLLVIQMMQGKSHFIGPETDPIHNACANHHHGKGSQKQSKDLADPLGSPFFQKSYNPKGVAEDKPHD
jgi:hypothetical protein